MKAIARTTLNELIKIRRRPSKHHPIHPIPSLYHERDEEGSLKTFSSPDVTLADDLKTRIFQEGQMGNISGHGRCSNAIDDPVINSPKIKLLDGRLLAYKETGVSKKEAKFRIIIAHGFGGSKNMKFLAPQGLLESLKIYMLLYDRAGYGESDPNPKRSVKSEAEDIEELADQLNLGSKFYVIGVSMGSYPIWSCLHYIPHRLLGVALVAPAVNYRWPSLPPALTKDDFRKRLVKMTFWLLKRTPRLLYWWMTQKVFPSANDMEKNPVFFNAKDQEVLKRPPGFVLLSSGGPSVLSQWGPVQGKKTYL